MDSVTGWPLTKVPLLAAEILDQRMIVIDRELRMPPRNQVGLDLHIAPRVTADHVVAGPDGLAQNLRAVLA